jgi:hypothetical protein
MARHFSGYAYGTDMRVDTFVQEPLARPTNDTVGLMPYLTPEQDKKAFANFGDLFDKAFDS